MLLFELYKFFNDKIRCLIDLNVEKRQNLFCQIYYIIKIVFNKTANKIETFSCLSCLIEQQPPKYDIRKVFSQMTQLLSLHISLNVSEIPTNAFGLN